MTERDVQEEMFRALGKLAKEKQSEELRLLERLSEGTLTPEERAELEARAAGSADLRARIEAHSPPPEDSNRALADRLLGAPKKTRARWMAPLAIAAAIGAVAVMVPRSSRGPVPSYRVEPPASDLLRIESGSFPAEPERGEPWMLRPVTEVRGPLAVRAFVRQRSIERLEIRVEPVGDRGVLAIVFPDKSKLAGAVEVVFVVARPAVFEESGPTDELAVLTARCERGAECQMVRLSF